VGTKLGTVVRAHEGRSKVAAVGFSSVRVACKDEEVLEPTGGHLSCPAQGMQGCVGTSEVPLRFSNFVLIFFWGLMELWLATALSCIPTLSENVPREPFRC